MASPIALSSAEPITAACHEESGVIEQNCCVYASYECMVAGYIIAGPKFSLTATNSGSEGEKKIHTYHGNGTQTGRIHELAAGGFK